MNLVVDCGNSTTKIAVFDGENIVSKSVFTSLAVQDLIPLFSTCTIDRAILSAVGILNDDVVQFIHNKVSFCIELQASTSIPIQNNYATPSTLGLDRLAVAVGANYLHPARNILIIDAGTAITYEFVDETNTYQGGSISPGVKTRFKSLHHYTQRLPLLEPETTLELFGNNTRTAMLTGVMNGLIHEIDGYVADFKQNYRELLTFLTGGDAFYFDKRLKSSIFVSDNLLLIGLNRILNFNACL
ncbi:MAG: type III pantothenate kinase [Paludibacteraceae bacterium]|nr:type III pantothenate kinase [Paludibacteraceae bacterium]MBP6284210.1 type III pantothenate kinase [Paludibacteraceae bacterium]